MSFTRRIITLTFVLDNADFLARGGFQGSPNVTGATNVNLAANGAIASVGPAASNQVTISGLRVQAHFTMTNGRQQGSANLRVYGLTPSLLNRLCRLQLLQSGYISPSFANLIVSAGDEGQIPATIFQGKMISTGIDMANPPDAVLTIQANAGAWVAHQDPPASSYPGWKDAVEMLTYLCALAYPPLTVENLNNLRVPLKDQYLRGSLFDQIQQVLDAARTINAVIENGKLIVWPKGGNRLTADPPIISPETGMVGYPTEWNPVGIEVRTMFLPTAVTGGLVTIKSSLQYANGPFVIYLVDHELESETPSESAPWFTTIFAQPKPQAIQ